ncbi:MAG: DUF2948 family protein [Defluviimonas sp.]|uniref:DUF2948 family protein n=1 Tax=Albidovulum sp. TaxID=1872424 RepID=UPI001D6A58ED|nr:DUF2948 family protein [Paracoccaceae bacterium]MCC0063600.1 DUF2948 family protein [Defluviimonas sp.]
MTDARFEDGREAPLRLRAADAADVEILSALVQDAVLSGAEIRYDRRARRLDLLVNRFRWEDRAAAERRGRPYERVRAVLTVEGVLHVASQGFDRADRDSILSILAIVWTPRADAAGRIEIVLAGDGAIAADVEYLGLALADVTRPYRAPSGHPPSHPD